MVEHEIVGTVNDGITGLFKIKVRPESTPEQLVDNMIKYRKAGRLYTHLISDFMTRFAVVDLRADEDFPEDTGGGGKPPVLRPIEIKK